MSYHLKLYHNKLLLNLQNLYFCIKIKLKIVLSKAIQWKKLFH